MKVGPGFSAFLFCFSSLLLSGVAVTVKIGVTIDANFHGAREQKFAIEAAAQLLNNTSTSTLFLDVRFFNRSNPLEAPLNARDLIDRWSADAIMSGGTWPDVAPVADLGSKAGVPVLSLATTPPPRIAPMRFLVSMSYPPHAAVRCMAELVRSYKWPRVIIIYEDDKHGTVAASMITLFYETFRAVGFDVDHLVVLQPSNSLPELRATVQRKLKMVSRRLCKVFFVVRASTRLAMQLFKEAWALGMMTEGHVWITDDETTDSLGSAFSSSFNASYLQGVIGMKSYFNKSTRSYKNFEERFKQRFQSEHSKGDVYHAPGISSLRAYDAVQVIALAVEAMEKKKSANLWEGISLTNFEGLSGHVQFKRQGRLVMRESSSLAFQVTNFDRNRYQQIGLWLKGHRFYQAKPVYWPGGSRRVPGGWGKLKIGVPARTSFDQFVRVEYDNKGNVKSVTGYCIDVFSQILKRLNYNLHYEFVPFNGNYDELVDQVYLKKLDAVVGDVTILAERLKKVEFTEPYVGSGLAMLLRVKRNRKQWLFMKPFTYGVWAVILLIFAYTAIILWVFERKDNPDFNGSWKRQLGATLWLIISTVFFAHSKYDVRPRIRSYYARAVIMAWLFAALIIVQSYTANLSSILTTQKLEPLVSDSQIGCDGTSFIMKYLQDVLGYPAQRIHKVGTIENYPKAFETGEITAAYMETPYLRLFLSRHKGYTVHGEIHRLGGLGFVFQRSSPLVIDFSEAILQLSEEGVLKDLEKKWFSFSLCYCPSAEEDENKDSIGLDNMWGVFLLTGGATTIVFIVFISHVHSGRSQRQGRGGIPPKVKIKRIWRLPTFKKKAQLELSNTPNTPSPGNTPNTARETGHDTKAEPIEALPLATMPHHEQCSIEEEIPVNQNNA